MLHKQTAAVVVSKNWVNAGVHLLLNDGRYSGSSGPGHMLIAPLGDISDQRGLWLTDITTKELTKDGSPVTMKLMVPWSFIYAVGIIEDNEQLKPVGFVAVDR